MKSRAYKLAWKNACQIFTTGISLCLDFICKLNNDDKNKEEKNYFENNVNVLFNYEKIVVEYYQAYQKDKNNLLHKRDTKNNNNDNSGNNNDLFNQNKSFEAINNFDAISVKSLNLNKDMDNLDIFSDNNSILNLNDSDIIFEHKNFFNNNNINNNLNNINIEIKKNNNKKHNKNNNKSNKKNEANDMNIIESYSKATTKKYKTEKHFKKKKIKQFYFQKFKRENVDKKILRRFKKYLKGKLKEKIENEVKNYIKDFPFWYDYIKDNLMPPFLYEKEKIYFKSFNTQYLCWFFEHKYSLELYNIFIKEKYEELLNLIKTKYKLEENTDEYNLLKTYINSMPLIYGNENNNRSTAFSSNIDESEVFDDGFDGFININNNKTDTMMIIESKSDNDDSNNNINFKLNDNDNKDFNIDNSEINNNINNDINNINEFTDNHEQNIHHNDFMNITPPNINLKNELDGDNNMNLDNSFDNDNSNIIKFDQNLFNMA